MLTAKFVRMATFLLDASVREGNSTGSDFTQFQFMDRAGNRYAFRIADLKDGLYGGQLSASISGQQQPETAKFVTAWQPPQCSRTWAATDCNSETARQSYLEGL